MTFQFQRRSYGWSGMYYISKGALRVSIELQQRCFGISFQLQRGCPSDFLQTESLRFPFHLRGVVHLEFLSHSQRLSIWQKIQRTPSLNLAGNPAGLPVEIVLRKTLLKSKGRSPLELKGNPDAPLEVDWKTSTWTTLELKGRPKALPWNLKAIQRAPLLKLKTLEALKISLQFQNGVPFNFKLGILSIWNLLLG